MACPPSRPELAWLENAIRVEPLEISDQWRRQKVGLLLKSILLNIMFHAPMGRFQLELIYFTYFSTVVSSNSCVFPVGLSLLIQHFQQRSCGC